MYASTSAIWSKSFSAYTRRASGCATLAIRVVPKENPVLLIAPISGAQDTKSIDEEIEEYNWQAISRMRRL